MTLWCRSRRCLAGARAALIWTNWDDTRQPDWKDALFGTPALLMRGAGLLPEGAAANEEQREHWRSGRRAEIRSSSASPASPVFLLLLHLRHS